MNKKFKDNYKDIFSEENIKKKILIHYGLDNAKLEIIKFKDTDKQRVVYKVTKDNISYCLKKVYFDEKNLLFVYSALEWLWKNGIKTPRLLNTLSKEKYVKFKNMFFILTTWIDGIKCDFDNSNHLIISIRQLAGIHASSRKFKPIPGSENRIGLSDYYISTAKHFNQLLSYYNLAYKISDKFSNEFLQHFDDNLELAKTSLYLTSNINDNELSKSLCHGDYVNKNIIFDHDFNIWVIDLDKCRFDYSPRDFAYFLRRLLKRDNTCFNVELTLSLLREYNNISKLTPSDLRYILAYISFPQKFWKLSRDYYKNITKCNKTAFLNLLQKSNDKTYFQLKFIQEILPRIESEYGVKL